VSNSIEEEFGTWYSVLVKEYFPVFISLTTEKYKTFSLLDILAPNYKIPYKIF